MAPKDKNTSGSGHRRPATATATAAGHRHQSQDSGSEDVSGLPVDLSQIPARVTSLTIDGLSHRTKDDILIQLAKDILLIRPRDRHHQKQPEATSGSPEQTFDQMIRRSLRLKRQLLHSMNGCFKSVSVTIDSDPEAGADAGDAYRVHVTVKEANRITGSVMTSASSSSISSGNGSPTLETAIKINNAAGRGETVSVAYSMSSAPSSSSSSSSSVAAGSESRSGPKGLHVTASKPLILPILPSFLRIRRSAAGHGDRDRDDDEDLGSYAQYPIATASIYDSSSCFPVCGFQQRERGFSLQHTSHWSSRMTSRLILQSDWRKLFVPGSISGISSGGSGSTTSSSAAGDETWSSGVHRQNVPLSIRELASGHFLKTGVKHVLSFDDRSYAYGPSGRQFSYFPCAGLAAEISSQICGQGFGSLGSESGSSSNSRTLGLRLPGNQSFVKEEASVQVNSRVPGTRIILQACARAGLILSSPSQPIDSSSTGQQQHLPSVALSEKFFVGGPMNVRAFAPFGIGPSTTGPVTPGQQQQQSGSRVKFPLGADVYWTAGLHAYAPLPFIGSGGRRSSSSSSTGNSIASLIDRCVRLHVFANAAAAADNSSSSLSLSPVTSSITQVIGDRVNSVTTNIRTSVGAGIVIAAGPLLRLELNYAIPVSFDQKTDSPDPGFQFGFGVHFN